MRLALTMVIAAAALFMDATWAADAPSEKADAVLQELQKGCKQDHPKLPVDECVGALLVRHDINEGSQWVELGTNKGGNVLSLRGPIKRVDKHAIIWMKVGEKKSGTYAVLLMEFDCDGKWKSLSAQTFDKKGNPVRHTASDETWQYVYPDSVAANAQDWACHDGPLGASTSN